MSVTTNGNRLTAPIGDGVMTDNGQIRNDQIPYLDKILPNLWIGNGQGACNEELINEAGITDIVNMALEYHSENLVGKCKSLESVERCGMRGSGDNDEQTIRRPVASVVHCMNKGGVVLSHCHAGCDRSVCVAYAAMIETGFCKTMKEAHEYAMTVRPQPINHPQIDLFNHFSRLYDKK